MPGDDWQKRANFRLLLSYMCAHPGKKLLFMGSEFGQWHEWRDDEQLEWSQLAAQEHSSLRDCVRDLNHLYRTTAQFYGSDCDREGFRWVDLHNADESIWAFARRVLRLDSQGHPCTCLQRHAGAREGYAIGVAEPGPTCKLFDSDAANSAIGLQPQSLVTAEHRGAQGHPCSLRLNLPPLGRCFHRAGVASAADGVPRSFSRVATPLGRHVVETRRQLRAFLRAEQPGWSSVCSMPTAAPKSCAATCRRAAAISGMD